MRRNIALILVIGLLAAACSGTETADSTSTTSTATTGTTGGVTAVAGVFDPSQIRFVAALERFDSCDALLDHYLDALGEYLEVDRAQFRNQFVSFVLIRLMQAMGAYGYRGFFERRRRFLESVPYAARNLDQLLTTGLSIELPELEVVFRHIVDRWTRSESRAESQSGLVVLIQSFSFRDGYPPDIEGHGGGFVFDCRALPNPHRFPELRDLTGENDKVVDFLDRSAEVQEFWENVRGIVDAHVERYVDRGFSSLTVSFGCTGGQHRSVFMAKKLAAHLSARYPHVESRVSHRRL